MAFRGFEGPAGTGKTHTLTDEVMSRLNEKPLESYQRALALTFMHGSRRRLNERFASLGALRKTAVCMTIDSFAHQILLRWRSRARALGIDALGFVQVCEACG